MNAMADLFSGPLAQAIGWALLHLLWQGVLVAAILAAALALLQRRSANARYLVSCAALALIVVLSLATGIRAYDPVRTTTPSESLVPAALLEDTPVASASISGTPNQLIVLAAFAGSHMPQIVLIWLVGVTLLSARLIVGWLGAHRLAVRYAYPVQARWDIPMGRI